MLNINFAIQKSDALTKVIAPLVPQLKHERKPTSSKRVSRCTKTRIVENHEWAVKYFIHFKHNTSKNLDLDRSADRGQEGQAAL